MRRMKASGEQFDDRIVEVHWDAEREYWRLMRFRDDKPAGNYKTVVDNIIKSIADGVEKEMVRRLHTYALHAHHPFSQLLERSTSIRNNWKTRHGGPPQPAPQARPPASHPPPHHALPAKPPPPPPPPPYRDAGPKAEPRYGPSAPSPWSKVTGPEMVAGMYR